MATSNYVEGKYFLNRDKYSFGHKYIWCGCFTLKIATYRKRLTNVEFIRQLLHVKDINYAKWLQNTCSNTWSSSM